MHFGVFDHLDRYDIPLAQFYRDRLALIEAYDRAGFYSYHLAEHHATPLGMAPSPSVFLASVAERTKQLRFGPMVYALPLYHPIRLVEEICMLDQLSGGRLDMGFGRGSSPVEIEYFGVESDIAHTQRVYEEALMVIRQGLATQRIDHVGEFFNFRNVPIMLEPVQKPHPPLWYGAHAPDSSARAARQAQNIISLDPPPLARQIFEHYDRAWRESHGTAPLPKVGIGRFVVVAETDAQALALARRAYRRWHESFVYLFKVHNRQMRHARPETFDGVLEVGQGMAGSPATVLAAIKQQIEGTVCNYFVGQFAFGDLSLAETTRSLDLFVKQVAPGLKES